MEYWGGLFGVRGVVNEMDKYSKEDQWWAVAIEGEYWLDWTYQLKKEDWFVDREVLEQFLEYWNDERLTSNNACLYFGPGFDTEGTTEYPNLQELSGRIEQVKRTHEIHAQVITRELDELKGEVSMLTDKVSRLEQPCPNCSALKGQVEYLMGQLAKNHTELVDAHDKLAELGCPPNVEGIGASLADKIQALYNSLTTNKENQDDGRVL